MHRVLAAALATVVVLAACGDGSRPAGTDQPEAEGGGPASELLRERLQVADQPFDVAEDAVERLEDYWSDQYPALYGVAYRPLARTHAVEPGDEVDCEGPRTYRDVKGRVRYCADDDAIVFDAAMLRELHATFGAPAAPAVLAHTWGRAVQARAGLDASVPPAVLDLQADCFAGAWIAARHGVASRASPSPLEIALAGYLLLRERTREADAPSSTAFDRVRAVADGLELGAGRCASFADPASRPARTEIVLESRSEGGIDPHDEMVDMVVDDLDAYWTGRISGFEPVAAARGVPADTVTRCGGLRDDVADDAPVAYCGVEHTVRYDEALVTASDAVLGNGATLAYLAHAWGRAAALALGFTGEPTADGLVIDCLSGTWAGDLAAEVRPDATLRLSLPMLDAMVATIFVTERIRGADLDAISRVGAFGAGFRATAEATSGPADACRPFL